MRTTQPGWLVAVVGPMFAGKTEEVIRRVRRARYQRLKVTVYVPELDTRHGGRVVSHAERELRADDWAEIKVLPRDGVVQGHTAAMAVFDEVQFYADGIFHSVKDLGARGVDVVVAGLDKDYLGRPFGAIPELLAEADEVVKLTAVCAVCGDVATRTYRTTAANETVVIGGVDTYEARCKVCHRRGPAVS